MVIVLDSTGGMAHNVSEDEEDDYMSDALLAKW